MDWIIFGDDFGAHPSTTWHLARHLPASDRVLWVQSLGMRAPRPTRGDLRRLAHKGVQLLRRPVPAVEAPIQPTLRVLAPLVVPLHHRGSVVAANRALLGRRLRQAVEEMGLSAPRVLVTNPVAVLYLDALTPHSVAYLRLDDYPRLPGVDAALVVPLEQALCARADRVFVTARSLAPPGVAAQYLPQGVDLAHFGAAPLEPPAGRTLGFFGLFAEWVDAQLAADVARACPQWTLEFLGPRRVEPGALAALPNVRFRPAVSYTELPDAVRDWRAAWIPFEVSALTEGVNPLKLREYLAAGLPTACTPLPAAAEVGVPIVRDAAEVVAWLHTADADTAQARQARRAQVAQHGWDRRAAQLRAALR